MLILEKSYMCVTNKWVPHKVKIIVHQPKTFKWTDENIAWEVVLGAPEVVNVPLSHVCHPPQIIYNVKRTYDDFNPPSYVQRRGV